MARKHVILLYGGRSVEHEVSCRSASTILRNLNPELYDVHPIAITKDGRWLPQDKTRLLEGAPSVLPIFEVSKINDSVVEAQPGEALLTRVAGKNMTRGEMIVFPILHGTFGEDGTLQGLLEMLELPFVGCDTLGSAVGMDKLISKKLADYAGVPIVPYVEATFAEWNKKSEDIIKQATAKLGFPMFVKPARLGSSVGINKVKTEAELRKACDYAFDYDDKLLIEKGLNVREIEFAILGGDELQVTVPGEVIPHDEFYTYDAKYISAEGASVAVPAKLDPLQIKQGQEISLKVFKALELFGLARVDLFLEKQTGKFYFNEVNTIPGFTSISQYPMLWNASGIPIGKLLENLIQLGFERWQRKARLKRSR